MIFLHLIFGIILGIITQNYFYAILGTIIADIDHIYILIKNKLFTLKRIIDSMKYEEKYNIKYKTPIMHSISGLIIFSFPVFLIDRISGIVFAIGYLSHLILDLPDIDEKYLLYPLNINLEVFYQSGLGKSKL